MIWITSVAADNLIDSYAARFRPNPESDGYLFRSGDYGDGLPCSEEQYHAYIAEFGQWMKSRRRFLRWWILVLVLLALGGMSLIIYFFGFDTFERLDEWYPPIGGAMGVLPIVIFFFTGKRIYEKPANELSNNQIYANNGQPISSPVITQRLPVNGGRRISFSELMAQRTKGMSWHMVVLLILVPLLGLVLNVIGFGREESEPYLLASNIFLGTVLVLGLVTARIKYRAHRKDTKH